MRKPTASPDMILLLASVNLLFGVIDLLLGLSVFILILSTLGDDRFNSRLLVGLTVTEILTMKVETVYQFGPRFGVLVVLLFMLLISTFIKIGNFAECIVVVRSHTEDHLGDSGWRYLLLASMGLHVHSVIGFGLILSLNSIPIIWLSGFYYLEFVIPVFFVVLLGCMMILAARSALLPEKPAFLVYVLSVMVGSLFFVTPWVIEISGLFMVADTFDESGKREQALNAFPLISFLLHIAFLIPSWVTLFVPGVSWAAVEIFHVVHETLYIYITAGMIMYLAFSTPLFDPVSAIDFLVVAS